MSIEPLSNIRFQNLLANSQVGEALAYGRHVLRLELVVPKANVEHDAAANPAEGIAERLLDAVIALLAS